MTIIRFLLGQLILLIDWITSPRSPKRTPQQQAAVDSKVAGLVLYHYRACPFCVKVRREMRRQGLSIELRDVKRSPAAREELLAGGGKLKVPCLRISDATSQAEWMFESSDIIEYLKQRISTQ